MNFKQVEKEYRFLKIAVLNGIEDYETLAQKLENEYIVNDEKGDSWKIDIDSGKWLWYDQINNEWIKKNRPGNKDEKEKYTLRVNIPTAPEIPKEVKRQMEEGYSKDINNEAEEKQEEKPKEIINACPSCGAKTRRSPKFCPICGIDMDINEDKKCLDCGIELKKDAKFCSNCGKKVDEKKESRFCSNCGKEAKPSQKFCGGCGNKLF